MPVGSAKINIHDGCDSANHRGCCCNHGDNRRWNDYSPNDASQTVDVSNRSNSSYVYHSV